MLLLNSMRERTIHPLRTISDRREGTQLVGEVELAVHEPWPAPDIVFVVGLDARVRLGLLAHEERKVLAILGAELVHVEVMPKGKKGVSAQNQ